jgi:F-type H+-transporting ATPase subunit beta
MISRLYFAREKFNAFSASHSAWPRYSLGRPGKQVPVAETVRGFKEILEGKHDEVPEGNFYMKGGIEEIKELRVLRATQHGQYTKTGNRHP